MVSYHDIQTVPKSLSDHIRATPKDILRWFGEASPSTRIQFVCGLLRLCSPSELRFFGSCLEELARLHYEDLRELESLANSTVEASNDEYLAALLLQSQSSEPEVNNFDHSKSIILDNPKVGSLPLSVRVLATNSTLRSQLIFRLSLLQSSNVTSANAYFEALVPEKSTVSSDPLLMFAPVRSDVGSHANSSCPPSSDGSDDEVLENFHLLNRAERNVIEEILLLYTLAAFHPAFTFSHRYRLSTCLSNLRVWAERFSSEQSKTFQRPYGHSPCYSQQTDHVDDSSPLIDRPPPSPSSTHHSTAFFPPKHLGNSGSKHFPSKSGQTDGVFKAFVTDDACREPYGDYALSNRTREKTLRPNLGAGRRGRSSASSGRTHSSSQQDLPNQRCCSCEARSSKPATLLLQGACNDEAFVREVNNNYPMGAAAADFSASTRSLSSTSSSIPHSPVSSTRTRWSDLSSSDFHFSTKQSVSTSDASDDACLPSTRTLTASDGAAVVRHFGLPVVSGAVAAASARQSRLDSHLPCEPRDSEPLNSSSSTPGESSDRTLHFHLSKHTKSMIDYCRVTPKRHSSGSSPISTPPSEDSGSETMACPASSTSSPEYWHPKCSGRIPTGIGRSPPSVSSTEPPSSLSVIVTTSSPRESFHVTTTVSSSAASPTPIRILSPPSASVPSSESPVCLHTSSHGRCISSSCPGSTHGVCESGSDRCRHSRWSSGAPQPNGGAMFSRDDFPELRASPTRRQSNQNVKDWVKSVQSRSLKNPKVNSSSNGTSIQTVTSSAEDPSRDAAATQSEAPVVDPVTLVTATTTTVTPPQPPLLYRFPQGTVLPPTHSWHSGVPPPSVPLFSPALYPHSLLLPHSSGVFLAAAPPLPSSYALSYPQWSNLPVGTSNLQSEKPGCSDEAVHASKDERKASVDSTSVASGLITTPVTEASCVLNVLPNGPPPSTLADGAPNAQPTTELFPIALPNVDSQPTHFILVTPGASCITPLQYLSTEGIDPRTQHEPTSALTDPSMNRVTNAGNLGVDDNCNSTADKDSTPCGLRADRRLHSSDSSTQANGPIGKQESNGGSNAVHAVGVNQAPLIISTTEPRAVGTELPAVVSGAIPDPCVAAISVANANQQVKPPPFGPISSQCAAPMHVRVTTPSYPPRANSQPANAGGTFNGRPFFPPNFMLYYAPNQPNPVSGSFLPPPLYPPQYG